MDICSLSHAIVLAIIFNSCDDMIQKEQLSIFPEMSTYILEHSYRYH